MQKQTDLTKVLDALNQASDLNRLVLYNKLLNVLSMGVWPLSPHLRTQAWRVVISFSSYDEQQCAENPWRSVCLDEIDSSVFVKQIKADVDRTHCHFLSIGTLDKFRPLLVEVLKKLVSYVPYAGYVQGIHDIALPILCTYYAAALKVSVSEIDLRVAALHNTSKVVHSSVETLRHIVTLGSEFYVASTPGLLQLERNVLLILNSSERKLTQGGVLAELSNHLLREKFELLPVLSRWAGCLFAREFQYDCYAILLDCFVASEDLQSYITCLSSALICLHKKNLLGLSFENVSLEANTL